MTDGMGQLNDGRGGRLRPVRRASRPRAGWPGRRGGSARRDARRHRLGPGDPGGRHSDDEGGPGDPPASVAWLARGGPPGTTFGPGRAGRECPTARQGTVAGRPIDPESGVLAPPSRSVDRLGRPRHWDPPVPPARLAGTGRDVRQPASRSPASTGAAGGPPHGGTMAGLSPWERWLELCARMDGFPRHLSIHTGGMLVTAAPLIDIAPLERATMPGRVVVQYDKRDVETLKLIKLDLLGLRMLAAIDETSSSSSTTARRASTSTGCRRTSPRSSG